MKDGAEKAESIRLAGDMPPSEDRQMIPNGPGVPRGRFIPEGDGGGARELSQDGTKPIGGRKNHPGSPPSGTA